MSASMRWVATGLVGALALVASSCSSWTGSHEIRFDDPYINGLPAPQTDGWLGMVQLFRGYGRVDRAFRLEHEGHLDAAVAGLAPYLDKYPEDLRVRAYYLGLLVQLHRTSEATDQADSILAVEPTYVPALLARACARAGQGRLDSAVQDFLAASRSPTVHPQDRVDALANAARYTLARGRDLEQAERWGEAAAAYTSALELPLTPRQHVYAQVGRHRSAALQAQADGNLGQAAAQFEAALAVDTIPIVDQRDILARLASVLEALGRPAEAGTRVEQLLALGPASAEASESGATTRGGGRAGTGDTTARATASALHRRAAGLFLAAGQPVRAATHLEAAGRLVGGTAGVGLLRRAAALYHKAGESSKEIAALREATAMAPSDRSVRAQLGRTLLAEGRPAEAERYLQEALAGAPAGRTSQELTDSRLALATAHEASGRVEEAMEVYREIAAAGPETTPARLRALERLALLLGEQGENRRAGARMMELFHATGQGSWARRAADSYSVAGAWTDAAVAYGAARESGALPGPEGARRLGVALYEAGEHDAAANVLATIPEGQRTSRDLAYLAAAAREAGDTDQAVTFYRTSLAEVATPADSATILASIGYALLQRDDSAAVVAMEESLRVRPDPVLRLDMAWAQIRLGRDDDALATLQGGEAATATEEPSAATDTVPATRALERLDLLTQVQLARGDTADALEALRAAVELEPTAMRLNRLADLYERRGDDTEAAEAFRRAYEAEPSSFQAARVGYAYRRTGSEVKAATWFRRSIDDATSTPADTDGVDLNTLRDEEALLTDRVAVSAYASVRQSGGATGLPPAGVGQASVASQGGVEVRVLPLLQRVPWGREVDVLARLLWAFDDGVHIDPATYQGQLSIRYRPRRAPGVALGLERWIAFGSAARDVWATRLQYSRLLGHPYPKDDAGPAPFAALYGDAAYLFDPAGTYTFYALARPGVAVPLGHHTDLIPHAMASAYRQSPGGIGQSRIEAGPGLGLRLRLPREHTYTRDFWSLELMAQYRWGLFPKSWGSGGGSYRGLVFTGVIQF